MKVIHRLVTTSNSRHCKVRIIFTINLTCFYSCFEILNKTWQKCQGFALESLFHCEYNYNATATLTFFSSWIMLALLLSLSNPETLAGRKKWFWKPQLLYRLATIFQVWELLPAPSLISLLNPNCRSNLKPAKEAAASETKAILLKNIIKRIVYPARQEASCKILQKY